MSEHVPPDDSLAEQKKAHYEEQAEHYEQLGEEAAAKADLLRRLAKQIHRSGEATVGDLLVTRGVDPETTDEAALRALVAQMEREEETT